MWTGMKMYDVLAGSRRIKSSFLLSKYETLERMPSLNPDKLKGSILYYDGNPFRKLGDEIPQSLFQAR